MPSGDHGQPVNCHGSLNLSCPLLPIEAGGAAGVFLVPLPDPLAWTESSARLAHHPRPVFYPLPVPAHCCLPRSGCPSLAWSTHTASSPATPFTAQPGDLLNLLIVKMLGPPAPCRCLFAHPVGSHPSWGRLSAWASVPGAPGLCCVLPLHSYWCVSLGHVYTWRGPDWT